MSDPFSLGNKGEMECLITGGADTRFRLRLALAVILESFLGTLCTHFFGSAQGLLNLSLSARHSSMSTCARESTVPEALHCQRETQGQHRGPSGHPTACFSEILTPGGHRTKAPNPTPGFTTHATAPVRNSGLPIY